MSKHRGTIPEKEYSSKQVLFEMMLIDENGYLDPREIYRTGGDNTMAKKVMKKTEASKAGKKSAKKSK